MRKIHPGEHICLIYRDSQDRWEFLQTFLSEGLELNQQVILLLNNPHEFFATFSENHDRILQAALCHQVLIQPPGPLFEQMNFNDSKQPHEMLKFLVTQMDRQGFTGLRIAGDMGWVLDDHFDLKSWIRIEKTLNHLLANKTTIFLCQYNQEHFPAAVLLDVLKAHPYAVTGSDVFENPYYLPAQEISSENPDEYILTHWMGWIRNRKNLADLQAKSEQTIR